MACTLLKSRTSPTFSLSVFLCHLLWFLMNVFKACPKEGHVGCWLAEDTQSEQLLDTWTVTLSKQAAGILVFTPTHFYLKQNAPAISFTKSLRETQEQGAEVKDTWGSFIWSVFLLKDLMDLAQRITGFLPPSSSSLKVCVGWLSVLRSWRHNARRLIPWAKH